MIYSYEKKKRKTKKDVGGSHKGDLKLNNIFEGLVFKHVK